MNNLPRFVQLDEYLALPREPQPWVIKNLIPVSGLINIYGKPKCFALDTPLLTKNKGWSTVGEVEQGDWVFGFWGQPVEVVKVHPIHTDHQCYRLTFTDGTELVADADHEWLVDEVAKGRRVKTTQEMFHEGALKKSGKYPKYRFRIPLGQRLEFAETPVLPIPPYALGIWLGDGTECNSQLTSADEEIINNMRECGYVVTKQTAAQYGWNVKGFHLQRQAAGITTKAVPEYYLWASAKDRRALLAGLLDTDGHAAGGVAEFYNTNCQIADAVESLARGLGYRVSRFVKVAKLYGKVHKPCHVVKIRAHEQVFRLKRKADDFKLNREQYQVIQSIEPVDSVPVKCFEVACEDHLIRIGHGLTVSYNTGKSFIALDWAKAVASGAPHWFGYDIQLPGPVAYLQIDTPREEWARRIEQVKKDCARDGVPLWIADMWLVPKFPVNVLEPDDPTILWLKQQLELIQPVMIVIDTLREAHGGDEDNSTVMRNVISALVGACRPTAIVLVSHARKDQAGWQSGGDDDMMDQNRGSSYVAGRMDVVVKVTQKRMQFKGRATGLMTEQLQQDPDTGWIELVREDDGSSKEIELIWKSHPEGLSVHKMAELLSKKKGYSISTATRRINEWNEREKK